MKKTVVGCLLFYSSVFLSMEIPVSEKSACTPPYNAAVVLLSRSGEELFMSDETTGSSVVFLENNKAKEFPIESGHRVFTGPLSGPHAAFSPLSNLIAALFYQPRTNEDPYFVLLNARTGHVIRLDDAIPVSGADWESGKRCNPLLWFGEEMLGVFSSGDFQSGKKVAISSIKDSTNVIDFYSFSGDGEVGSYRHSIELNGLLLRAAQSVGDSLIVACDYEDGKNGGERKSALRIFSVPDSLRAFGMLEFTRTLILPKQFPSMSRVTLSHLPEQPVVVVGASGESDMYVIDYSSATCLARLTLDGSLVSLCASPRKDYLLLVTEEESKDLYPPKKLSLVSCKDCKNPSTVFSDTYFKKGEEFSGIVFTESNQICIIKNGFVTTVPVTALIGADKKGNLFVRKGSLPDRLTGLRNSLGLRNSFSKIFN